MQKDEALYSYEDGRGCIGTYSRFEKHNLVDVFNPTVDMICIEDIAHALSNQCRFGGHTREFYSVAQHSIHVSEVLRNYDRNMQLAGLLHDASEAYLIDVPRPVKLKLTNYKEIEVKLMGVIAEKFGIGELWANPIIKHADEYLLNLEWRCLMVKDSDVLKPKGPSVAKNKFLQLFEHLTS